MADSLPLPQSLVRKAVAGDALALQQLLLDHYPIIEASVRARFNDQLAGFLEPEDVIQEVLIKVHRSIATFAQRDEGGFEAWLRSIAANCIVDAARRAGRQKRGGNARRLATPRGGAEDSLDTIWGWLCEDSPLPEQNLRRAEARQAIQVCLSELQSAQREAVVAHYFEHLDTGEIAARMDRTPGAVRELLRRARERLRELMGTASTWLTRR